jgi:PAS domain-containing protein
MLTLRYLRGVFLMKDSDKTKEQPVSKLEDMRQRVAALEKSEAKRKQAEEALRQSENYFRDLLENANDLIQSVAPDGRFVLTNRVWRKVLGYSEEEVAHLTLWDIIHPDHMATVEKFSRRLSQARQ